LLSPSLIAVRARPRFLAPRGCGPRLGTLRLDAWLKGEEGIDDVWINTTTAHDLEVLARLGEAQEIDAPSDV
jgi:hypothetical protein